MNSMEEDKKLRSSNEKTMKRREKMKRLVVIWLALALVMIAGFYGVSLARTCGGGGFEGTGCEPDDLLDPTSGPYVYGTFTVALDKSFCSTEYSECRHYNIHAV